MKKGIFIGFLLATSSLFAQNKQGLYTMNFEQLDDAFAKANKSAVIFLSTPWCTYCKAMEKNTFTNEAVIELMNSTYYFVPFNAESREAVIFSGVQFNYQPSGKETGIHELATTLAKTSDTGTTTFPMLVIINRELEILYQYSGFMDANQLLQVLSAW